MTTKPPASYWQKTSTKFSVTVASWKDAIVQKDTDVPEAYWNVQVRNVSFFVAFHLSYLPTYLLLIYSRVWTPWSWKNPYLWVHADTLSHTHKRNISGDRFIMWMNGFLVRMQTHIPSRVLSKIGLPDPGSIVVPLVWMKQVVAWPHFIVSMVYNWISGWYVLPFAQNIIQGLINGKDWCFFSDKDYYLWVPPYDPNQQRISIKH